MSRAAKQVLGALKSTWVHEEVQVWWLPPGPSDLILSPQPLSVALLAPGSSSSMTASYVPLCPAVLDPSQCAENVCRKKIINNELK